MFGSNLAKSELQQTDVRMPISSLVVTLDSDPNLRQRAVAALAAMSRVTLGEPYSSRLPVVVETATLAEGRQFVEQQLTHLEGVRFVDVVRIDFEDLDGGSCNDDDSL